MNKPSSSYESETASKRVNALRDEEQAIVERGARLRAILKALFKRLGVACEMRG